MLAWLRGLFGSRPKPAAEVGEIRIELKLDTEDFERKMKSCMERCEQLRGEFAKLSQSADDGISACEKFIGIDISSVDGPSITSFKATPREILSLRKSMAKPKAKSKAKRSRRRAR